MSYNPSLLFYKHYYESIQFGSSEPPVEEENKKKFQARNKVLLATRFNPNLLPLIGVEAAQTTGFLNFSLTTTYPGLILGTGYSHGTGLMGEFKTGFYFDHTTGMPVIPGSTIKGLLRSTFPGMYYEKADKAQNDAETAHFWRRLGDNRMLFVASIIQALGYELDGQPNAVLRLEREIFEGLHGTNREKPDDYFGMRDRDIFFDAVITGSSDSMIFSDEYITPHRNPLKNPVPIQILKVQPGVTFTFQFNLKDAYHTARIIGDAPRLLTSAQRLELFRQILMFFGAGAKTNSGFGHFESDGQVDLSGKSRLPKDEDSIVVAPILIGQKKEDRMQEIPLERVKKGNPVYAEVIKRNGNILYFRLFVSGYSKEAQCMYHADNIQSGQFVQLLVRDVGGKGDNRKIVVAEPCLIF